MQRDEWLQHRMQGIGSSEAAALHDASPYLTRFQLWEIKTADKYVEPKSNLVMQRGNALEPIARQKFASLYNIENNTNETFEPRLVEMSGLEFMKASLDGASQDLKDIVEIKYQGKEDHIAVLTGTIKDHYRIQVMHQLLVSGAERAFFVSFDGETLNTLEILPDPKFLKLHFEKCVDFWELVQNKTPPELSDRDYKKIKVKGAKAKAFEYKLLSEQIKDLENRQDALKKELIAMCGHNRNIIGELKIVKQEGRAGIVDYGSIVKKYLPEIDVEPFRRKKGEDFWVIK